MEKWSPANEVTRAILEAREELSPYLKKLDLNALARHNRGYLAYAQDPVRSFIDYEIIRYIKTADFIYRTLPRGASVIDLGLFIPVIPIALSKLGFQVTSVEKLAFYGDELNEIIALITNCYQVHVVDLDILTDELHVQADIVLLLAILEHLNGTPRHLLERAKCMVKPDGYMIVEVPNAATLTKRLAFLLKGTPPFPSFADYYYSEYPFSGHNREYTVKDIQFALQQSGLKTVRMDIFHHGTADGLPIKSKLLRAVEQIGPADWRPSIWCVVKIG
jgi:SAM-dependent methyltransferase